MVVLFLDELPLNKTFTEPPVPAALLFIVKPATFPDKAFMGLASLTLVSSSPFTSSAATKSMLFSLFWYLKL